MNISLRRIFLSELMFWLVVAGIGIYFLIPLRQTLRFGMDLAGGTYLTLEVQTDEAVKAELVEKMQSLTQRLKKAKDMTPRESGVEDQVVMFSFESVNDAQEAAVFFKSEERDLEQKVSGSNVSLSFSAHMVQQIKDEAVSRNIEVLRVRSNKLGVADIPIAAQGEKNIIIELPDVSDPQQAKAMIGKAAQLEFRIVDKTAQTKDDLKYEYDGDIPADKEILPGKTTNDGFYLVQRYAQVTGRSLRDARSSLGGKMGVEPVVSFQLNPEGGDRFYELTSKNPGKALAIVLDGIVISAPRINEGIRTEGQISGRFTPDETKELAMLLKSGSFVAPVTFEEHREIGPSLGEESIRRGLLSCLVGLGLLFLFSIFYYRLAGLFACIALVYNLILVLMGLSWLQASLTLQGIAGMVLTIGMAIDASVLIFERIKEELAEGVTVRKAVNEGFAGAMKVILDGNITTFIVGVVLYQFGTGPIQGFAVTMMLGIIATLITGLFFLRSLFTFVLDNFDIKKLSI